MGSETYSQYGHKSQSPDECCSLRKQQQCSRAHEQHHTSSQQPFGKNSTIVHTATVQSAATMSVLMCKTRPT